MASTRGDIVASNILGEPRPANYEAVPRVVYTDPQPALGMQPQPPAKLQDQGAMVQLYSVLAWETTNYNTLT